MLSQAEIFAISKKAARGAGFSWGMAEEAASATVALYFAGQDGFTSLTQVLENADGRQQPLSLEKTPICGLTLGVYLADCGLPPKDTDVIGGPLMHALCGTLENGTPTAPFSAPEIILGFAHRTYVSDSEESRRRGAG